MQTNPEASDFVIICGKHLATEKHFTTEKEAWTYLQYPNWDTVLAIISEVIEIEKENQKNKEV